MTRWISLLFVLAASGCAATERAFPLRDPMTVDTDLQPVTLACRPSPTPKDPRNISCAPDVYVSPLIWDGTDNMLFRPLSEAVGVVHHGEAVDVNSLDEVPDSSWFTNRIEPPRPEHRGARARRLHAGAHPRSGGTRRTGRGSSITERPTGRLRASG